MPSEETLMKPFSLQNLFSETISAPGGVEMSVLGDQQGEPNWEGSPKSISGRMEIYSQAHCFLQQKVMEETFPAGKRAVNNKWGESAFRGLVTDYLDHFPLRSPNLRDVGKNLSKYLNIDPMRKGIPWLIDLTRAEWASWESFFAPDVESSKSLAEIGPDNILQLDASLRPVVFDYDVTTLWTCRYESEEKWVSESSAPSLQRTFGVWSRALDGEVHQESLTEDAFSLLNALMKGKSLRVACEAASCVDTIEGLVAEWVNRGWVLGVSG